MAENQESKMEPQTEETKDEEYKETSKASMVIWHSIFLGKFTFDIYNLLLNYETIFFALHHCFCISLYIGNVIVNHL